MYRSEIVTILAVLLLCGVSTVQADIVELGLLSLGCPTEFDFDSPYWQSDFDMGIEFCEIDSVYMNWSGEITAGLAIDYDNPDEPYPLEVGVYAYLGIPPDWHHTTIVWGGETTYPSPELFESLSEIQAANWTDYLDGKGTIGIQYTEWIMLYGEYIEHGSITLSSATLIVDGVIVPEPATLLLFCLGGLFLRRRS